MGYRQARRAVLAVAAATVVIAGARAVARGATPGGDWTARGAVTMKDGAVEFDADGPAHVERPCAFDAVRVTARVSRWASVYLVWDGDDWCGVGKISPTPFGRLYSNVVAAGAGDWAGHYGVDFNAGQWVRISAGENYVRFEYSSDGTAWKPLRTVERPAGWSGAPKLVAAGRDYETEDRPFASSPPAKMPGGRMAGRASEIAVEALPADQRRLSDAEVAALRTPQVDAATALLLRGAEPTYDAVAAAFPAMKSPREVVGVAGHPLDIGVDRLGRLDVSPWAPPIAWFELGGKPFARPGEALVRRRAEGCLPVETLSGDAGEMTVFGWSEGMSVEKPLVAYVRVRPRAGDAAVAGAAVAMVWDGGKQRKQWPATDGAVCLRFTYPDPATVAVVPAEEFDAKRAEVLTDWRARVAPAARFDVPDARLSEAYRAWIVYSMLNADTINGYLEPHDGAGFYEEMFGNSVSLHTMAFDLYGLHDWAARVLATQVHFQTADGLYTQACGLTDPGAFLAGLAAHYRVTGDAAWFERVSAAAVKQCDWLVRQRAVAPKDGMVKGLIKFRPYNDYPDPVYNYLGNAWCAVGMERAAAAMKAVGMTAEGEKYAAEAAAYRADVLASMQQAAIVDRGQTILPMEPETHRLLKLSHMKAADYYGLVASSLLGTGILDPQDKRATWLVDMLEKRHGLIAGVCDFDEGIDHAYTYGYLMNAMRRDEVRKTLLGFWSMMAFGMTRDTYSPVEVTMIAEGDNQYTLPHLYSCTEQLRLLRNMLVMEDGNVLWLGRATPRAWLEPGKHVAVSDAPTEFGPVSYRMEIGADGAGTVHIDLPTRRVPAEVRVRLREPRGRKITAVDGPAGTTFAGDTAVLKGAVGSVDLRVRFGD